MGYKVDFMESEKIKKFLGDNLTYIILSIIIVVIWIPFLWLYYCLHPWKEMANYLTMGTALAAFTGTIISIIFTEKRTQKQLNKQDSLHKKSLQNSNNQLIEQLTRENKEKAIFNFLNKTMQIINKQKDDYNRMWDSSIKDIVELDKESKECSEHNYFGFDLLVQNDIYYYFKSLVNNPYCFNYLPSTLQENLEKFVDDYHGINTRLILYLGLHFEGNGDSWNGNPEISNVTVLNEGIRSSGLYKLGNYLTKELHNEPWCQWISHYCSENYSQEDINGVIVKIDEEIVDKFEVALSNICVLAYEESLKYGYNEI